MLLFSEVNSGKKVLAGPVRVRGREAARWTSLIDLHSLAAAPTARENERHREFSGRRSLREVRDGAKWCSREGGD
jgi:hypothetical protein